MKVLSRAFFAASAAALGGSFTEGKETYDQFQALGFRIFTGAAPPFTILEPPDCNTPENCPVDTTLIPEGFTPPDKYPLPICLDCIKFNPACDCDSPSACLELLGEKGNSTITISNVDGDSISIKLDTSCYPGRENVKEDVEGRVAVMKAAVQRAYEVADPSSKVLKIFQAPEFFWRGNKGAYSYEDDAINEITRALQAIVQDKRFVDWLFVFGTIVSASEVPEAEVVGSLGTDFLNFAPVYKGFDPKTTSSSGMQFIVPKRYISTIDFLSPIRTSEDSLFFPGEPGRSQDLLYDNQVWNDVRSFLADKDYTLVENNWLYINDIAFSLEICLDHANSVARRHFTDITRARAKIPSGGHGKFVEVNPPPFLAQISLVVSAGMEIAYGNFGLPDSLVLTPGGSIFLQDGYRNKFEGILAQSDVQTCTTTQEYPTFKTECVQCIGGDVDVYDSKEEAMSAIEGIFSQGFPLFGLLFTPQVKVYAPVDIVQLPNPPPSVPTMNPSSTGKKASQKRF